MTKKRKLTVGVYGAPVWHDICLQVLRHELPAPNV